MNGVGRTDTGALKNQWRGQRAAAHNNLLPGADDTRPGVGTG